MMAGTEMVGRRVPAPPSRERDGFGRAEHVERVDGVGGARRPAEPQRTQLERNDEMTKNLMMMAAVVSVAFGAWADTETVGGYTWTYRITGDIAEILI